jgi:probable phosphomutase (TIGR03848 family)
MSTLLLIRHGRTTANATGVLAGRTPGIELDERGREQAAALGLRLAELPLAAIVTSPLERTRQTAAALLEARTPASAPSSGRSTRSARGSAAKEVPLHVEDRVSECDYGHWAGRELKVLAKEPLWQVVQNHPSAVTFPGGEAMTEMSARAVQAVRDWNEKLGPDGSYALVSHGDVIKAIVADALGMHLDMFQRIQIDPCSVTVIRYSQLRPFVLRVNDTDSPVGTLIPARRPRRAARRSGSDAQLGGGAGAATA